MMLLEKTNWKGPKRLQKVNRNPKVTTIMKILSDNIGIEIYTPEFKKSLENIVDNLPEDTSAEDSLDNMQPIMTQYIVSTKLTPKILALMASDLQDLGLKS